MSSQKMTMGTSGHTPSAVFICQRASFKAPAPSFVQCLAASPSFYGQFSLTLMPSVDNAHSVLGFPFWYLSRPILPYMTYLVAFSIYPRHLLLGHLD